jgi:YtkA-like protein
MKTKLLLVTAVLAVGAASGAFASAQDYVFVPIQTEIAKGDDVTVTVRLLHKPTGKSVSNAAIIRTRMDMGPDGMAEMGVPVKSSAAAEPGTYAFKADLSMPGRWAFSLAARVQGEPETVVGKITLTVKP